MQTTQYNMSELQAFVRSLYADPNTGAAPRLYVAPFAYPLSITNLAQGTSQNVQLAITANADFLALGIKHHAHIAAAQNASTKTVPFIRILVTDSGTNEQWTNAAIDLENYSTNVGDTRMLPFPRLVQGKSSLAIQVSNWAPTAETYAVDISIEGLLIKVLNSTGMMVG